MTCFTPARGVWLEHSRGVAIVAFPAMVADRCFASPGDLMRAGGMRPN